MAALCGAVFGETGAVAVSVAVVTPLAPDVAVTEMEYVPAAVGVQVMVLTPAFVTQPEFAGGVNEKTPACGDTVKVLDSPTVIVEVIGEMEIAGGSDGLG